MKKLFLFSMLICLPMVSKAADVVINGIFYNLSSVDKTAEVTFLNDSYNSYSGDVVIPATITYGGSEYSVKTIGGWAFRNCNSLISVIIPVSVTAIGFEAFTGCSSLTTVSLHDGIVGIREGAFKNCSSLTSIKIPNNVLGIGSETFMGCSSLTTLIIGNHVTDIWENAFRGCSGLTSVIIPNSVTNIRERAFYACSNLESLTIGSSVKYIADYAFQNCSKLESIYCFAKTVPVAPYDSNINMFKNTPIGNATLYVPASSIEQYKVSIPWYGFGTFAPLDYIDGVYYSFNEEEAEVTFRDENYNSYSGDVFIPATVKSVWGKTYTVAGIGEYAFKGSRNMSTVTIPNSVKSIGMAAFDGCSGLESIIIPENVSNIGNVAFRNCSGLSSIIIPNNVTTINVGTFYGCASLASITIPSCIEYISNFAFQECKSLADVYCLSESVPNTNSTAFDNSPINSATLHTPNKSIHLYKNVSLWSDFGNYAGLYGNSYTLLYTIDGSEYKAYKVWEDEKITTEDEPEKEGYTFSGWSDIPEWMPAHDVTVTGSFSINSYALTYIIDGEEYKKYEIEYSASIMPEAEPTKEGYTFSGWSEIPETMPAHDVTVSGSFSINSYKLTYMVDDEEYKSYQIDYGTSITAEVLPTKVGYTFSGWSEIPETMPAHDVTVTGSFSVNLYSLIYIVDDGVYKTYEVEYGTEIIPEEAPKKTGYTFSGWNDIPSTMPAKNVTISGTFTINNYKLTYIVDEAEYKTVEVEYNSVITPESEPTKEGYTFSGWSEIPETMPANDVTVTGSFIVNKYQVTYIIDGEVFATDYVEYGTAIVPPNVEEKEGFTFSGWVDIPETMPAHNISIYGSFTSGIAEILLANQRNVLIYSPNGKKIDKLQKGINIVILDDGTVKKVMIK